MSDTRPGTISPKAKQLMLLSAACLGMLINTIGFVALNEDRLTYQPSRPIATTGPRVVLLGTVDMTGSEVAAAPRSEDPEQPFAPAQAWRLERLRAD